MTILEILLKGAGIPADAVRKLLRAGAAAVPDLAGVAEAALAELDKAATPENVVALGAAILSEGRDLFAGKLSPRSHPSDAA